MYYIFEQGVNALQDIAKALHDADRTNIYLVISTAILAGATIIFGILDGRRKDRQIRKSEERQDQQFKKQFQMQDDEQFERLRPWITITEPVPVQVIFQSDQAMGWDRYLQIQEQTKTPSKVRISSKFTNTGFRPARKLKKIGFARDGATTREEVENMKEDELDMDMGPDQLHYHFYDIPWESYNNSNQKPLYFILRISYENGRYRSYSGVIYKLSRTISQPVTVWYI